MSVSSECRSGSLRSRPIGASIRPRRERGRPRTSARYVRSTARRRSGACRRSCASSERATTSRPDVSRSSRCTMPGRSASSPPAAPCSSRPWTSVPSSCPARDGRRGLPACRRRAGVRPRRPGGDPWPPAPAGRSTGSGTSTSTVSPPWSRWLFGRRTPSTSTRAVREQPLRLGPRADLRRADQEAVEPRARPPRQERAGGASVRRGAGGSADVGRPPAERRAGSRRPTTMKSRRG